MSEQEYDKFKAVVDGKELPVRTEMKKAVRDAKRALKNTKTNNVQLYAFPKDGDGRWVLWTTGRDRIENFRFE